MKKHMLLFLLAILGMIVVAAGCKTASTSQTRLKLSSGNVYTGTFHGNADTATSVPVAGLTSIGQIAGGLFLCYPTNAQQSVFDAEELIAGSGYVAGDSGIAAILISSSTNCYVYANEGGISSGAFVSSTNCNASSGDGGMSGGNFDNSTNCFTGSSEGGVAAANFGNANNSSVISGPSCFAGASMVGANNVNINDLYGIFYGNMDDSSNVNITINSSFIVVNGVKNYTNTFNNAFGVVKSDGSFAGYDGTNFTGNGSGLTGVATIGTGSGIVTNNGLVWCATNLALGTAPNITLPNGSLLTTTGGCLYVRTNGGWLLK